MLGSPRRLVIKVGSSLLADGGGAPDGAFTQALAEDVARLRGSGVQVVLVSSGAVALGRAPLGLAPRADLPLDVKQAAAAAGQARLMEMWGAAFAPHGAVTAQVLLTRGDTETRRSWLNGRSTLTALLRLGAIPVINENDTVATEELRFGDNDRLAARVAQMIAADVLLLLSDVDGLHTADPRRDPSARHLAEVAELTPEIWAMASGANVDAGVGTGGMASKLAAAAIAREAGCTTFIAAGRSAVDVRPLRALERGARATRIAAASSPQAAYKAWIAGRLDVSGALVIDAGAAAALAGGSSLLPAGVVAVRGEFGKGDPVAVIDPEGREVARGLVRRGAETVRRVAGLRSGQAAALGVEGRPELIHKDDLVFLSPRAGV